MYLVGTPSVLVGMLLVLTGPFGVDQIALPSVHDDE